MKYGYARVSSRSQDHKAQIEALKAAGCEIIFSEKKSAKNAERPEFIRLMKALKPSDTVVVVKLDRLVRSSRDLANIMFELDQNNCSFVSLIEAWCDTTTDVGQLVMTIMGGIAEFERKLIHSRCEEGIERGQGAGDQVRPRNALDPSQRREVAQKLANGATVRALQAEYDVGVATIMRALNGP